jgi:hypothetical protein
MGLIVGIKQVGENSLSHSYFMAAKEPNFKDKNNKISGMKNSLGSVQSMDCFKILF